MKWISVKDSLPRKNQWVLAYGYVSDYEHEPTWEYKGIIHKKCKLEIKAVQFERSDPHWPTVRWYIIEIADNAAGLYNVTHWMPLPEAPKEEHFEACKHILMDVWHRCPHPTINPSEESKNECAKMCKPYWDKITKVRCADNCPLKDK